MNRLNVIGIDVGGTRIKAALVNGNGEIKAENSVQTPNEQGGYQILSHIVELVHKLQQVSSETIEAIGIGAAGRIDSATGTVLRATGNLPGWAGKHIKAELEQALSMPVFVDNDVNAAALGEGWLGAGQGIRHYALIALGTGVGGALVHDGSIITGPQGGAGEIGHMILHPAGHRCNCGQSGCLEQYTSGTALGRFARNINRDWDSRMLMERLELGDPRAVDIIGQFVADLSFGLVSLYNLYDPELIIIGGGVAESSHLWWNRLLENLHRNCPQPVSIVPAKLGNRAGMLGSAHLAFEQIKG
jgi:glucokinase